MLLIDLSQIVLAHLSEFTCPLSIKERQVPLSEVKSDSPMPTCPE
jgi:hypothetical protein